jgi:tetratricopeptide (TPR) repeat protein
MRMASRARIAAVGLAALLLIGATPAQAARLYFGMQEHLAWIADVELKGANGEALYLGHKYSYHSFLLPYRMTDDGYVLGVRGEKSYFRLDNEKIKSFQAEGLLPSPLPPYQFSLLDYAMGYALWIFALVLIGLAPLTMLAKRRRKRAQPHLDDGIAKHQSGNLNGAIESYTQALTIDPKFSAAYHLRGKAFAGLQDLKRSISDQTKALRIDPKFADALMDRGILLRGSGNFDGAISDFSRIIKLTKSPLAYFQRGLSYLGKNDCRRAIADFTTVIKAAPDFAEAYRQRAIAHSQSGDNARAQADMALATANTRS